MAASVETISAAAKEKKNYLKNYKIFYIVSLGAFIRSQHAERAKNLDLSNEISQTSCKKNIYTFTFSIFLFNFCCQQFMAIKKEILKFLYQMFLFFSIQKLTLKND